MEYDFTFTLRHWSSPLSVYIRVQPTSATRGTRQTDRRTNTAHHFI